MLRAGAALGVSVSHGVLVARALSRAHENSNAKRGDNKNIAGEIGERCRNAQSGAEKATALFSAHSLL